MSKKVVIFTRNDDNSSCSCINKVDVCSKPLVFVADITLIMSAVHTTILRRNCSAQTRINCLLEKVAVFEVILINMSQKDH